jgi:hypothetical protein
VNEATVVNVSPVLLSSQKSVNAESPPVQTTRVAEDGSAVGIGPSQNVPPKDNVREHGPEGSHMVAPPSQVS